MERKVYVPKNAIGPNFEGYKKPSLRAHFYKLLSKQASNETAEFVGNVLATAFIVGVVVLIMSL